MRVNEIFYSLQGEGYFCGTPAVFVRFSGCNLSCPFCDTAHQLFVEMGEDEIVRAVSGYPARHVVLTGGEPTLQVTASLVRKLRGAGRFVQLETNGTCPLPAGAEADWITCSPKGIPVRLARIDELKVVFWGQDVHAYEDWQARVFSLQPCDVGDAARNLDIMRQSVEYVKQHPQWRLSVQTHKLLGIR